MKLGLLTDIHSHAESLQAALDRLRAERVDQIVVIGDVVDLFGRQAYVEETCRLLTEARAVGVWGNHDYGLCVEPDESVRAKYPPAVLDFMGSLRPRLEVAGCFVSHVEPWLNAEYMPDLWYGGGPPATSEQLDRIFAAVPHRAIFGGHYHVWHAATPEGVQRWDGTAPIAFGEDRHFVVVNALSEGNFAVYDTQTANLIPMRTRDV
jgi:hypothetical protein